MSVESTDTHCKYQNIFKMSWKFVFVMGKHIKFITMRTMYLSFFIHPSIFNRLFLLQGRGEPGAYPRKHRAQGGVHPGQGASPSQGTITYTLTHTFIHYGHFRHANQSTMHVFGLGEETGVPGGNPRSTGRTCKLRTHMAPAGIEPRTLEV